MVLLVNSVYDDVDGHKERHHRKYEQVKRLDVRAVKAPRSHEVWLFKLEDALLTNVVDAA